MGPPRQTDHVRRCHRRDRRSRHDHACGRVRRSAAGAVHRRAPQVLLCYTALNAKTKFGYDDSLDAFGVHGVGGTLGTVMAGRFCFCGDQCCGRERARCSAIRDNWPSRPARSCSWLLYSFVVSLVLFKMIDMVMGIRVSRDEETEGLDITQHGESGYTT